MKLLVIILLVIVTTVYTACDFGTYVMLRNYGDTCQVKVAYDWAHSNTVADNDTIQIFNLETHRKESYLLRRDSILNQYNFIAPAQKMIVLSPQGLNGHPISDVWIQRSDGVLHIDTRDNKKLKQLKKQKVISRKGPIGNVIIINNH